MTNVKGQGSKEIQRPDDPKSPRVLSFDIHLTFEICHLKLVYLSLFHMAETGIVHTETEKAEGAHLGRDLYPHPCL